MDDNTDTADSMIHIDDVSDASDPETETDPESDTESDTDNAQDSEMNRSRQEKGIIRTFETREECRDSCQHSIGREVPHRFISSPVGNGYFDCAYSNCLARRRYIGKKCIGLMDHNHDEQATGKHRWLTIKEVKLFDKLPRHIEPGLIGDILPIFENTMSDITDPQIRQRKKYLQRKTGKSDLFQLIDEYENPMLDGPKIIGHIQKKSKFMVVVSADELIDDAFVDGRCVDGQMSMDANMKSFLKLVNNVKQSHSLLQVGFVDKAYRYHVIAYGVGTGEESPEEVEWFLEIVEKYARSRNPIGIQAHKWMIDGSGGLRNAIMAWYWKRYLSGKFPSFMDASISPHCTFSFTINGPISEIAIII